MAWSHSDTMCLNLLVLFLVPVIYSAPLSELGADNLGYYPVSDKTGCYYNFQHYDEGDRIFTNEPCLNCTCHNKMLMCYLRVCPFVKAYGDNCRVEKRADLCCPIITCPEVPVPLIPSNETQSSDGTALARPDDFGCTIDGLFYADGVRIPGDPNKPCELCYCIRNKTACVMQECTLKIQGCLPVYHKDICCPIRYDCDRPALEGPSDEGGLVFTTTTSTTTTTTTTTTTEATTTASTANCYFNDQIYLDGEKLQKEKPCEACYCMKGHIVCAVQECAPTPLEKINCTALPPIEGECCPSQYECDNISGELSTTEQYTVTASGVTEIYGVPMIPIDTTLRSEDTAGSDSENASGDSITSLPEESEPKERTTISSSSVEESNELTSGIQENSSESSIFSTEEKITISEHGEDTRPTIPSESQVTTEPQEEIATVKQEVISEDSKPTEKPAVPTTTEKHIVDNDDHQEGPASDDTAAEDEKESDEHITSEKTNDVVNSEATTISQVLEEHANENPEMQTENPSSIHDPKQSTPKEEEFGPSTSSEEIQTAKSASTINKYTEPAKGNEVVTTLLPKVEDISEGVSAEQTTKAQISETDNETVSLNASQTTEKSIDNLTESPQVEEHIPISENAPEKPTSETEIYPTISENISTEKDTESVSQQTERTTESIESEEKIVTTNPTVSEEVTHGSHESEDMPESTEHQEKPQENIGNESSSSESTTMMEEDIDLSEKTTESANGKATITESTSENNTKDSTVSGISTEKIDESPDSTEEPKIVNEQTTISDSSEEHSVTEHSGESSATEASYLTEKSTNVDENIRSTTFDSKQSEISGTTEGTLDNVSEKRPDETIIKEKDEFSTENPHSVEHQSSISTESVTIQTSDETTDYVESESHSTGIHGVEPDKMTTEATTESHDSSEQVTEQKLQETTILDSSIENSNDDASEVTSERTVEGKRPVTTEKLHIPELTSEDGSETTLSSVLIENSSEEDESKYQSSSESLEIYDASITPEIESTEIYTPGKSSTVIIPSSNTSPESEENTTAEVSQEITQSVDSQKEPVTTESNQGDFITEKSVSTSTEPAHSQEPKIPSTSNETLTPITTESSESHPTTEERLVPGEGSCLVDGVTYENNAHIDPINQCQVSCKCINSIVKCESVQCDPPAADLQNCMAVYPGPESCCPIYNCATPGEQSMESDSQKKEHENEKPTVTSVFETPESSEKPIDASGGNIEQGEIEISTEEVPVSENEASESTEKSVPSETSEEPSKEYENSSSTANGEIPSVSDGKETEKPIDKITDVETSEGTSENEKESENPSTENYSKPELESSEEVTIYIGGTPTTESSTFPKQENSNGDVTVTENILQESEEDKTTRTTTVAINEPTELNESNENIPSKESELPKKENPSIVETEKEQETPSSSQVTITEDEQNEVSTKPNIAVIPESSSTDEQKPIQAITETVSQSENIPDNLDQTTLQVEEESEKTTTSVEKEEPFTSRPSTEEHDKEITTEKLIEAEITTQKLVDAASSEYSPLDVTTTEKQLTEEQSPFTSPTVEDKQDKTEKTSNNVANEPYTSKPSNEQSTVQPSSTTESFEKPEAPIHDDVNNEFEGEENVESSSPTQTHLVPEVSESSSSSQSTEHPEIPITDKFIPEGENQENNKPSEEESTEPEHVTVPDDTKPEMPENDNLVTEVPSIVQESHETTTQQVYRQPETTMSSGENGPSENVSDQSNEENKKPSFHMDDSNEAVEDTSKGSSEELTTVETYPTDKPIIENQKTPTESNAPVEHITVTEKIPGEVSTESSHDEMTNPTTVSVETDADQKSKQTTEKSAESTESLDEKKTTIVVEDSSSEGSLVEDIPVMSSTEREPLEQATEKVSEKAPETTEISSEEQGSGEKNVSAESDEKQITTPKPLEVTEEISIDSNHQTETSETKGPFISGHETGDFDINKTTDTFESTEKSDEGQRSTKTQDSSTESYEQTNTESISLNGEATPATTQKSAIVHDTDVASEETSLSSTEDINKQELETTEKSSESTEKKTTLSEPEKEIDQISTESTKLDQEGERITTEKSLQSNEPTETSESDEIESNSVKTESTELSNQGNEVTTAKNSQPVTDAGPTESESLEQEASTAKSANAKPTESESVEEEATTPKSNDAKSTESESVEQDVTTAKSTDTKTTESESVEQEATTVKSEYSKPTQPESFEQEPTTAQSADVESNESGSIEETTPKYADVKPTDSVEQEVTTAQSAEAESDESGSSEEETTTKYADAKPTESVEQEATTAQSTDAESTESSSIEEKATTAKSADAEPIEEQNRITTHKPSEPTEIVTESSSASSESIEQEATTAQSADAESTESGSIEDKATTAKSDFDKPTESETVEQEVTTEKSADAKPTEEENSITTQKQSEPTEIVTESSSASSESIEQEATTAQSADAESTESGSIEDKATTAKSDYDKPTESETVEQEVTTEKSADAKPTEEENSITTQKQSEPTEIVTESSSASSESIEQEATTAQSADAESTESGSIEEKATTTAKSADAKPTEEQNRITTQKPSEPKDEVQPTEGDISKPASEVTTLSSLTDEDVAVTEKQETVSFDSSDKEEESHEETSNEVEATQPSVEIHTEPVKSVEKDTEKTESQQTTSLPESENSSETVEEEKSSTALPIQHEEKDKESSSPEVPEEIVTSPKSVYSESESTSEGNTEEVSSESTTVTDQKEVHITESVPAESTTALPKEETTLKTGDASSETSDGSIQSSTEIVTDKTDQTTLRVSSGGDESTSFSPTIESITDNKIAEEISTEKSHVLSAEKDKEEKPIEEASPSTDSSVNKESEEKVTTASTSNIDDKQTTIKLAEPETTHSYATQETEVTKQYPVPTSTEKTASQELDIFPDNEKESDNVGPVKESEKIPETTTTFVKTPIGTEITTPKQILEKETYRPTTLSQFIPTVTTTTTAEPEKLPSIPDYSEPEYEDNGDEFGPGTCRYGGKVYVSAQQIPRDDPCDFCFCFRSDIICLQQSCPPPIRNCHQEPIRGFCCPRYECPVNMAVSMNFTTTTSTTTTTLPPHFLSHAYQGKAKKTGCLIDNRAYQVGDFIPSASGPCLQCKCGGNGQMECNPVVCSPSPMLEQMLTVAATSKRRR